MSKETSFRLRFGTGVILLVLGGVLGQIAIREEHHTIGGLLICVAIFASLWVGHQDGYHLAQREEETAKMIEEFYRENFPHKFNQANDEPS